MAKKRKREEPPEPGAYRILVRFRWPDGTPGFDFTPDTAPYVVCKKFAKMLRRRQAGWFADDPAGVTYSIFVDDAMVVGPVHE